MSEELEREGFARALAARDRLLVLYHARWCPYSERLLPRFEEAEPESSVPFARADLSHPLDPRWDDMDVRVVPTLVYYEHGEPLERLDGLRGVGITPAELDEFLQGLEDIQEEAVLFRGERRPRR